MGTISTANSAMGAAAIIGGVVYGLVAGALLAPELAPAAVDLVASVMTTGTMAVGDQSGTAITGLSSEPARSACYS